MRLRGVLRFFLGMRITRGLVVVHILGKALVVGLAAACRIVPALHRTFIGRGDDRRWICNKSQIRPCPDSIIRNRIGRALLRLLRVHSLSTLIRLKIQRRSCYHRRLVYVVHRPSTPTLSIVLFTRPHRHLRRAYTPPRHYRN